MRCCRGARSWSCMTCAPIRRRTAFSRKCFLARTTTCSSRFRRGSPTATRRTATSSSSSRTARPSRTIQTRCCAWIRSRRTFPTTGHSNMANGNGGVVVTRTPLRVSFAGGGTDLADVYENSHGAVLSTAIDKYIYVTVKRHSPIFNEAVRINYSRSETVNSIGEIQNAIARECLRLLEIDPPIYVSTVGDLPASTGLGGSSAFAVGLLNALHAFRGERVTAAQLAEEACHIEIDVLKQPIGKQDQYAAAFGGLNFFSFERDGIVKVEPQRLNNGSLRALFQSVIMFWTGHQRDSSSALIEQKANTPAKMDSLLRMREHAMQLKKMTSNGGFDVE